MTYPGLGYELDNTPWWLEDTRRGTGQGLGRCNIFGAEDQPSVLGGTRDFAHEPHMWVCHNWADGKYRITCANGHAREVVLCYAHVYQFRRRMSSFCPRCAMPDAARQLEDEMNGIMRELAGARDLGARRSLAAALELRQHRMNELVADGTIRSGAPLEIVEMS